jgi:hypothetical protein
MARKIKIDNAELKRRAYKESVRKPKKVVCRILIVCEGEKTEPNYFKAFDKRRNGLIVYELSFDGGGISTTKVVDEAIRLRDKTKQPFDRVWAVFDKDSFPDAKFNAAILKAQSNDIGCAWSNEAFELWYLLHFVDRTTGMKREEYEREISRHVNNSPHYKGKKPYSYAKNDPANHAIVTQYGDQSTAIKRAKALEASRDDRQYAKHNPCTTVYKLVEQLMGQDDELNNELITNVNE